jgi:predicted nuclease of restriction endonuclease-like RecB superfamily
MLTRDLVRARVVQGRVSPSFLDPTRRDLVEAATDLCALVQTAARDRWRRGAIEEALELRTSAHRSRKALAGLARLLLDAATFEEPSGLDPVTVRAAVFRRARERGPLALEGDALGRPTAAQVLAEVAVELNTTAAELEHALYADLREQQLLIRADPPTPEALLHRYNVALVQAVLLRAWEVEVTLTQPDVPRVRQLLRRAKFHQLMVRARWEGPDLHLLLDGPASVLQQSNRYGLQLAQFFPAIPLHTGAWRMVARLSWEAGGPPVTLELSQADGLRSHLADTGAWQTPEQAHFAERWAALGDTGWTLDDQTTPIPLDHRTLVLPDFSFHRDGRTAHLDIIGYWRKDWLERRLDALRQHTPGNYVLAVSKRLGAASEAAQGLPGEVITFAQVVPARAVLDAVERVAR